MSRQRTKDNIAKWIKSDTERSLSPDGESRWQSLNYWHDRDCYRLCRRMRVLIDETIASSLDISYSLYKHILSLRNKDIIKHYKTFSEGQRMLCLKQEALNLKTSIEVQLNQWSTLNKLFSANEWIDFYVPKDSTNLEDLRKQIHKEIQEAIVYLDLILEAYQSKDNVQKINFES